jgi:cytochrome c-type biogenesis protein CcmF
VLLGTVFPLVIEALSGERLAVGRPYFDRMTMPIGFALLFLMAVAPLLPWRRTSGELVRHRLAGPAWVGTLTVVGCVVAGLRGLAPLLAFGLAAFAATATLRQLVVSARRTRRANGGLVVHLGVVLIAVAFAASQSYASDAEFRLRPGESATLAGHTLTYLGSKTIERPHKTSVVARVRVDGDRVFAPALHTFPFATQAIGSPSVRTGLVDDVYLTLLATPKGPGEPAVIGVIIQPLILWLWVGGGLMALGTALAVWPRRRRRQLSGARSEPASGTPEALPASEPAVVGS